jgi:hypothetical protein
MRRPLAEAGCGGVKHAAEVFKRRKPCGMGFLAKDRIPGLMALLPDPQSPGNQMSRLGTTP